MEGPGHPLDAAKFVSIGGSCPCCSMAALIRELPDIRRPESWRLIFSEEMRVGLGRYPGSW